MAPPRLWLSFLLGALVVTGCPRRFDPRASEIHSQNPEAEADFRAAHRKWQEGDKNGASAALRLFLEKHGAQAADPLLPLARFELGLCEYQRGEFAEALRLLTPFSGQIVDGEEATELHAVLADLYRRAEKTDDALREYELFYRSPKVRPLEQLYIRTQIAPLLAHLSPAERAAVRARFGLEGGASTPENRHLVVGLVLPLSGKDRALGERVLRGALWATQALGAHPGAPAAIHVEGSAAAIDLRVRDSNGPGGPAKAVAELERAGVQAIIGSPVRAEAKAIAAEAEKRGLLALHLSALQAAAEAASEAPGRSFGLLRSNEARAESLAQYLRTTGLSSVAVLAPATPYGQTMTRAFVAALAGAAPAVHVVAELSFSATATTFTAQARQLLELAPQAVFVPATADKLELIAAQLAAVGALATYRVEKRESEPPVKLLLASAEGMGERLIKNAGRYLQGAVLAPIFSGGARIMSANGERGRFAGYFEDGGGEPGALDALGHDAVVLLRSAFLAGCAPTTGSASNGEAPCSSEKLAAGLHKSTAAVFEGATGPLLFDAAGQRSGPGWLLRVEGSTLLPLAVEGRSAKPR